MCSEVGAHTEPLAFAWRTALVFARASENGMRLLFLQLESRTQQLLSPAKGTLNNHLSRCSPSLKHTFPGSILALGAYACDVQEVASGSVFSLQEASRAQQIQAALWLTALPLKWPLKEVGAAFLEHYELRFGKPELSLQRNSLLT